MEELAGNIYTVRRVYGRTRSYDIGDYAVPFDACILVMV